MKSTEILTSTRGQERSQSGDVVELVVVRVALGDRVGRGGDESVVVGDVGRKTTDASLRGTAGLLEKAAEQIGSGLQVGGPSEPASMACIGVEVEVGLSQSLPGPDGEGLVGVFGVGALLDAHVGDHVGQAVGLVDGDDADIGI